MRGHKVRIYPNASQEAQLLCFIGHSRFVYNELLARNIKEYEDYKNGDIDEYPSVTKINLTNKIMDFKKDPEFVWLYDAPHVAYQQKARDLSVNFNHFFRRLKLGESPSFPKFKKKGVNDSFRLPDVRYYRIIDGRLRICLIPKTVKVSWDSRGFPNNPLSCTISKDKIGRWFATFVTESRNYRTSGEGKVGLDMGLTDLVTTSDGEKIHNPKYFVTNQKKLARIQRKLSNKKKGSNNRNKQRSKLAKMHAKIADSRRDYMHKLTTRLINENQVIGIEDLAVNNMMKNRTLSKAIGDASWSMFFRMLVYKAMEAGVTILQVDRFYPSSQTCNICDHQLTGGDKLKLHVRKWTCPKCDSKHDRDINAAKNILKDVLRNKHTPVGLIRVEA